MNNSVLIIATDYCCTEINQKPYWDIYVWARNYKQNKLLDPVLCSIRKRLIDTRVRKLFMHLNEFLFHRFRSSTHHLIHSNSNFIIISFVIEKGYWCHCWIRDSNTRAIIVSRLLCISEREEGKSCQPSNCSLWNRWRMSRGGNAVGDVFRKQTSPLCRMLDCKATLFWK